jgi:hypothetical protein
MIDVESRPMFFELRAALLLTKLPPQYKTLKNDVCYRKYTFLPPMELF